MASSKKTSYFLAQRHGHSEVVAFLDELERREEAAAAADGGREGDAFKTPPARKKGANANAAGIGIGIRIRKYQKYREISKFGIPKYRKFESRNFQYY